jgi:hypothetical protein
LDLKWLFDPNHPTFLGIDENNNSPAAQGDVSIKFINRHGGIDGQIPITDISKY